MTGDEETIQPNGKAILNWALPGTQGGYALMLREEHGHDAHITYLTRHFAELRNEHNLGTLGVEMPPFIMLYHWGYRDAQSLADKEIARQALIDAYIDMEADKDVAVSDATMVLAAIDEGIDVIAYDGRYLYADNLADNKAAARGAQEIRKEHPEYKAPIDAIENAVIEMKDRNIPIDAIWATVTTQLADPRKNMITISGARHLDGQKSKIANGIFDESVASTPLADTYWHVTDGAMGSLNGLKAMTADDLNCQTRDRIDFLWRIKTDEVVARGVTIDGQQQVVSNSEVLLSLLNTFDPCQDAELAQHKWAPEQLNPSMMPELQSAIDNLKAAFQKPAAPAAPQSPVSSPLVSR